MLFLGTDDKSFEQWFRDNTDIPEGIEPFTMLDDGTYFWKETRDQYSRFLDLKLTAARIDSGLARLMGGMGQFWILDEDGRTPKRTNDIMVWGACQEDEQRKRVGWDFDNDKRITVSTVFLGLSHGSMDGKPVLFETMIFSEESNTVQRRYCSWADAEEGHQLACDLVGIKRRLPNFIEGEVIPDTPALPAPGKVD